MTAENALALALDWAEGRTSNHNIFLGMESDVAQRPWTLAAVAVADAQEVVKWSALAVALADSERRQEPSC
jgi:hypothetical protein